MSDRNELLRQLPSVASVIEAARPTCGPEVGHARLCAVAQTEIDAVRISVLAGDLETVPTEAELASQVSQMIAAQKTLPLVPVINATGIIVHTGLGRAPIAAAAARAMMLAASGYAPVELDMKTGDRGQRTTLIKPLLAGLTGAESATVVNNNAAALMLVLATFASDRNVLVSRGELIEIGGSFRLPEVMAAGGAILREVGTTNKTRLADYEKAIGPSTAAILKVHTSNYRVEGFTEAVEIAKLAELAKDKGVILIDDIGSGLLEPPTESELRHEPDVTTSLAAGADLVLFSGDKLLGGPQAGIIVGRGELIDQIEAHPMMRALRVDKVTLSALASTLQLYRDAPSGGSAIPVRLMLAISNQELEQRGRRLLAEAEGLPGVAMVTLEVSDAYCGGGANPTRRIESRAIRLIADGASEDEVARVLRLGSPPVLARCHDGAVWFDLRTIPPELDDSLIEALGSAVHP